MWQWCVRRSRAALASRLLVKASGHSASARLLVILWNQKSRFSIRIFHSPCGSSGSDHGGALPGGGVKVASGMKFVDWASWHGVGPAGVGKVSQALNQSLNGLRAFLDGRSFFI